MEMWTTNRLVVISLSLSLSVLIMASTAAAASVWSGEGEREGAGEERREDGDRYDDVGSQVEEEEEDNEQRHGEGDQRDEPQERATTTTIEEIDIDALQQDLYQTAASLRQLYYAQITSDVPQLDVLFHCAIGLTGSPVHSDHDLCVEILESLLEQGYMQQECRLELARALAMMGYIVRARAVINECLRIDPDYAEAREFAEAFDEDAKTDGKIALFTIVAVSACAGLWYLYRRTIGAGGSGSSPAPSSVHSATAIITSPSSGPSASSPSSVTGSDLTRHGVPIPLDDVNPLAKFLRNVFS